MFRKRKAYFLKDTPASAISTEYTPKSNRKVYDAPKTKQKHFNNCKTFQGLFYTAIASISLTMIAVFVKQLSYMSPGQLSVVSNAGSWTGSLPICVYCVKEVFGSKDDRLMLVVRSFLASTALYLNYTAFRYLPLAEAVIVMSTLPAVTTIMARVYLKEPCGLVQGSALVINLCGVLLSIRLSELFNKKGNTELDFTYVGGLASAVGSVLIFSVCYVVLRKMKDVHFSVSLMYLGLIGVVVNGATNALVSYFAFPRCGWDQITVMAIGIFGFIGNCTLIRAIQIEFAGVVSVMKASMDIVIAMVFQIVFFNVSPDIYSMSGAFLVIASISIIGFTKWLIMLPEESNTRIMFKYLLF